MTSFHAMMQSKANIAMRCLLCNPEVYFTEKGNKSGYNRNFAIPATCYTRNIAVTVILL